MLANKCFFVGVFTLLSVSLAIAAPPAVHPVTGDPLVIDCLRGTPDAIDGDLSDWNLAAMTPAALNVVEQLFSGQSSWVGPEDCSGEFYLLWDDVNIYMAVVVKDEKLSMNKTGGNIWNADCVEVFFSTTNAVAGHNEHYQYGFNANNQKWNWCNMDGAGSREPGYLQIASSATNDGYICEVAVPYGQMPSLNFSAGNTVGFHPVLDDTDNGDRELQMTWTGREAHDQSLGFGHMVLSAEAVPAPEPVDPGTEGLVVHYAFENNAEDSSANALHGTLMGDPVFAAGRLGMALDFDGNGDYVDCGTNAALDGLSAAMTASGWINIRSVTHLWMAVMAKGENAWRISVNNGTLGLHFGFTGGDRGWQAANSASQVALNEWHHVAATYDLQNGAQIYIDGAVDGSNPDLGGVQMNTASFLIGENPEATGRFFDGLIDEVAVYDRALSEREVRYLAGERAKPVDPGTDGLMASYALENNTDDGSGNGHNGVPVGDPEFVEGPPGYGMAMYFDGDDCLDTGYTGNLPIWSISCWVKSPAAPAATSPTGPLHREKNYQINWNHGDATFRAAAALRVGGTWYAAKYEPVEADTWYHITATYDGEDLKAYRNGDLITTNTVPSGPSDAETGTLKLGRHATAAQFFTGTVDEATVYGRALSTGEIRYLAGFRENLLLNPSFEEDEAVLDDPDWAQWCTWNPAEGAGSNAAIVDTEAIDGSRSLRIEPKGTANWHFIVLYLPILVDMDKNYDISFWAKAEAPRPLTLALKAEDNSISAWGATDFQLTTEWAEYTYTSEVLIDVVKLEIWCSGTEVPFWLDLVSVCEGK